MEKNTIYQYLRSEEPYYLLLRSVFRQPGERLDSTRVVLTGVIVKKRNGKWFLSWDGRVCGDLTELREDFEKVGALDPKELVINGVLSAVGA